MANSFESRLPETVFLEIRKLAMKQAITGHMLDTLTVEVRQDPGLFLVDQFLLEFRAQILAHRLPPEKITETAESELEFPATPWQMWKQDHAGSRWWGWIARRWPVGMKKARVRHVLTVDLQRFRNYPDAPAVPSEYGIYVRDYQLNTSVKEFTQWQN